MYSILQIASGIFLGVIFILMFIFLIGIVAHSTTKKKAKSREEEFFAGLDRLAKKLEAKMEAEKHQRREPSPIVPDPQFPIEPEGKPFVTDPMSLDEIKENIIQRATGITDIVKRAQVISFVRSANGISDLKKYENRVEEILAAQPKEQQ